jgi:hypothetical protein
LRALPLHQVSFADKLAQNDGDHPRKFLYGLIGQLYREEHLNTYGDVKNAGSFSWLKTVAEKSVEKRARRLSKNSKPGNAAKSRINSAWRVKKFEAREK